METLTPHFTLSEMTASGTALRLHIDNTPDAAAVANLEALCRQVLEPLRQHVGRVIISSGYRSPQLNKAVGGVDNSQHLLGEAADIHCTSLQQARQWYDYVRQHLDFDQLLLERRLKNGCCWLHVSHVRQPGRRQNRHDARLLNL